MKLIRLGYQWNLSARGFIYHNNLNSLSRRQHGASPGSVIVCVRHNWQRRSWRRCQRRRRCWRYCGSVAAKAKGVQSEIGRATVCIARSFKFPQSERDRHWERQRQKERERVPVDKRKPYKGYTRISGNLFTVAKTKRRHCVVYVPHIESPFVSIPERERKKENPVLTMSAPMKFIIAIFCLLATAYNIRGE